MSIMKHSAYDDLDAQHLSVGAYSGGKCLTGHQSVYKVKDSCSYRWQGIRQAKDNPEPYTKYNAEYGSGFGPLGDNTIRTVSQSYASQIAGSRGGEMIGNAWIPKKNQNDPKPQKVIKLKPNGFTTGWSPWKNMVHHVLPSGALVDAVAKFSPNSTALQIFIRRGLLNAAYNNNYKINMIILPVQPATSRKVGLPTHARGDNHPVYYKKVQADVEDALDTVYGELKSQMEQNEKDHKLPDHKDLKKLLEDICSSHYAKIVAHGKTLRGSNRRNATLTLCAHANANL